jgi:hypothetical protein
MQFGPLHFPSECSRDDACLLSSGHHSVFAFSTVVIIFYPLFLSRVEQFLQIPRVDVYFLRLPLVSPAVPLYFKYYHLYFRMVLEIRQSFSPGRRQLNHRHPAGLQ